MLFSPEKCHLSIRLCTDGFSFYIALIEQQRLLYQKVHSIASPSNFLEEAKAIIYNEEMMFADFRSCSVVVNDYRTLITPSHIDEEGAHALYSATYKMQPDSLLSTPLHRSGLTVWFSVNSPLLSFLKRSFAYSSVTTSHALILELLNGHTSPDMAWQLFVDTQLDHLTLYLFHHGLLHSITHRAFLTSADAAYHTLNLWQTSNIDAEASSLLLFGNAFAINEILPLVQRFVPSSQELPLSFPDSLTPENVDPAVPIDIAHLFTTLN